MVGNLLTSVAGAFIGTTIAHSLFHHDWSVADAGGDESATDTDGDQTASEWSDPSAAADSDVHPAAHYSAADYSVGDYDADLGGAFGDF